MNDTERRSDDELADAVVRGDSSAGDTLTRRHALDLYDFAVRTVLDSGVAMQVTEAAFRRAREQAAERPQTIGFRPWLFGLARNEAFEGLRQRSRPDAAEAAGRTPLAPLDPRLIQSADPSADPQAIVWAWQAARGQRPRDYSLLDLALRRRLTPGEIADIGALSRTGVYAVLGRLRGAFEEAYAASALSARGRDACPELEALIKSAGDDVRGAARWEMVRHSEGCAACRETLSALPSAADLFVSLLEVEPPVELARRLLPIPSAPPDLSAVMAAEPLGMGGGVEEEEEEAVEAPAVEEPALLDGAAPVEDEIRAFVPTTLPPFRPSIPVPAPPPTVVPDEPVEVEAEAEVEDVEEIAEVEVEAPVALAEEAVAFVEPEVEEAPAIAAALAPATETAEAGPPAPLDAVVEAAPVEAEEEDETPEAADEPLAAQPPISGPPVMPPLHPAPAIEELRPAVEAEAAAPSRSEATIEAAAVEEVSTRAASLEAPVDAAAEERDVLGEALGNEDEDEEEERFRRSAPLFRRRGRDASGRRGWADEDADDAAGGLVPVGAGAAAAVGSERIRFIAGDGRFGPPRRPWSRIGDAFGEGGGGRFFLVALIGGLALLLGYVGWAIGDSIQGGGDSSGGVVPALPTRTGGVREIACGEGPLTLDQGSRATLAFDPRTLPSFQISDVTVRPRSAQASAQNVSAKAAEGLSIQFEALAVPDSAGRTDQYQLTITFSRGSERVVSDCAVNVRGPAAAPVQPTTAPPPATTPSPGAAGPTRTPTVAAR